MSSTFDARVLLSIAVVILAARLCGMLAERLRQPPVIGEVVAGILLGPTLLGALPGDLSATLFPEEVKPALVAVGTLGVVFYVFLVGLDLHISHASVQQRAIVSVTVASFAVPFLLGTGLGVVLHDDGVGAHGEALSFALFVGTAMSVTALPVLARIIEECRLVRHRSGEVAMSSAVLQEPLIWFALALCLFLSRADESGALARTLLGTTALAAGLFAIAWMLRHPRTRLATSGVLSRGSGLTPALGFVCATSAASAAVGIHPVIGALAAGVALPRQRTHAWRETLRGHVDPMTRYVLLPVFLVLPGLSIDLGSLPLAGAWQVVLVFAIACVGKGATSYAAARWSRMERTDALLVGVLMNTRGLVELVVLNVGFAAGLISERVFAVLLLAALLTTTATGPLVERIQQRAPSPVERELVASE